LLTFRAIFNGVPRLRHRCGRAHCRLAHRPGDSLGQFARRYAPACL
jgi:hypothetical protein